MGLFLLLLVFWAGFIIYLFAEKYRLDQYKKSIPIRIAVNGTRGKTGAARMIASALRANGIKVCAKTSGSETRFINPDGSEETVPRTGSPSVIEQVRMMRKASALGAKAIVYEIMGIQPEHQILESKKIINPAYTVIVNARIDHPEQGESKAEVMKNYLSAVPTGSRIFRPPNTDENYDKTRLVLELCRSLGLDEELCGKAIHEAEMDKGAFRIFHCEKTHYCNLFAVNDVQSTRFLMDRLYPGYRVGLFNSRLDRPWRSLQFVKAAQDGLFDDIRFFFVMGNGAALFRRKLLGRAMIIKSNDPRKIMDTIKKTISPLDDSQNSTVQIIGMGNIKGAEALLDYWQAESISLS